MEVSKPIEQLPLPGIADAFAYEDVEDAINEILIRAHIAQDNVGEMFEMVMRGEIRDQRTLTLMPHQELIFAFVDATKFSVIRMPVGTSKTFCMSALTMHLIGKDPTARGAIASATQTQAAKVLGQVKDYIENDVLNAPLRLIFPELQRSTRPGDAWTQTKLVVERPAGIRDPSLVAIGIDTEFQGSRFSWCVCDDLLSQKNTRTPEQREVVHRRFDGSIMSRIDPGPDSKLVVTNTPWNRDDITYRLANAGWPTMTMSIYGDIRFENVDFDDPKWEEVKELVRLSKKGDSYRLVARDPDPEEETPLWPERIGVEEIADLKQQMLPQQFAQTMMCQAVDDDSSQCPQAWIDRCLNEGNGIEFMSSLSKEECEAIDPKCFVVTGIDLAAKKLNASTALTVFFTALVYPNGDIQPLKIDAGRYLGPDIVRLAIEHHEKYNSMLFVEENGVQIWIHQWIQKMGSAKGGAIPIWPHHTGVNKYHPSTGLPSVFILMHQGKWIIPNDEGKIDKNTKMWLDQCRDYIPGPHTGDLLMASWFAVQGAEVVRSNNSFFFEDEEDVGVKIFGVSS